MRLRNILSLPAIYQIFQEAGGFFDARVKSIGEYLALTKDQCVVDIGCGPGFITNHLPDGIRYHGFDIDRKYVQYATAHFSTKGLFYCERFDKERAAAIGPADVVMMNGLIHHLDDETARTTLQAAHYALKRGGTIFTLDGCLREGQSTIARLLLENDRGQFVRDEAGYRSLLESAFEDARVFVREDLSRVPYTFAIGLGRATNL